MMKVLFRPIDAASLTVFRIGAGLLMSQELVNGLLIGKFDQYVAPEFNFSYQFFGWVKPWPYWGMALHYAGTIFAGLAVAVNFHCRVFSIVLFLGQLLLFLFEQTEYINHSYLYCLLSFWMIFMPLGERHTSCPAWPLYLIRFHMGLAYFFGGVAKLNPDWLGGSPMNLFLDSQKGGLMSFLSGQSWSPFLYSYGGVAFDLLVTPLLLWRRSRPLAFLAAVLFHVSNAAMFGLGTFPWFSIFLSMMFFGPSFPRQIPVLRDFLSRKPDLTVNFLPQRQLALALLIYGVVHTLLPFRHWLYPGDPSWTEQGHMFAWRMMLRHKEGRITFFVKRKSTGQVAFPDPLNFITRRQLEDMRGKPDLILQFSHFLRDHYQEKWGERVSVFASAQIRLNGRTQQEMIEPGTDLAREQRDLRQGDWIRQLNETPSEFRSAERD